MSHAGGSHVVVVVGNIDGRLFGSVWWLFLCCQRPNNCVFGSDHGVSLSSSPTSVAVPAAVAVVRSSLARKGSFVITENICGCGLDIDRGGGLCVVVGDISDRFLDIPCRSFLCIRQRHMWIYPRQWPQWRVNCRHRRGVFFCHRRHKRLLPRRWPYWRFVCRH